MNLLLNLQAKIVTLQSMKKKILFVCGVLCVVLATTGIFIPLLPTTPFLILAAACFLKSSEKTYLWLISNKVYGKYIAGWIEKKGVPLRVKIFSLVLLWTGIGLSFFLATDVLWIRILLIIILLGVTIHIVSIKKQRNGKI